ncbi:hypothetical protein [Nitriliruptor alkaliphilus]|uniref:hypothetical protein n=1 Tax=Nitriliruptor alkaliphilus TaxID=427918 RepID=UPI0006964102|nr:hypothetical protein [Nitriliruptor alkaliphilus]
MFVQVIRGAVRSEDDAMAVFERWLEEVRPDAVGYLGTTAGVTDDGELVVVARFASEDEARRNSGRPEQGAWWEQMEQQFTGEVRFYDCADVATFLDGGDDEAGFVQVMQSSSDGSLGAADLAAPAGDVVSAYRPDVLGGLVAIADDGTAFQVVYFTSEEEARAAEAQEMPPEVGEDMERIMRGLGDITYLDLHAPRTAS